MKMKKFAITGACIELASKLLFVVICVFLLLETLGVINFDSFDTASFSEKLAFWIFLWPIAFLKALFQKYALFFIIYWGIGSILTIILIIVLRNPEITKKLTPFCIVQMVCGGSIAAGVLIIIANGIEKSREEKAKQVTFTEENE